VPAEVRDSCEVAAAPASEGAPRSRAAPARSRKLPLLLCLLLAALAYRELATWSPRSPGYSPLVGFFFGVSDTFPQIVLGLVAALVLLRLPRLRAARGAGGPVALAGGCLLAGAGLFLWARLVAAPDLELLSLIPVTLGSAWLLFGGGVAARLAAPLALLIFAVPWPGALTNLVVYPLQLASARVGALLLRGIGSAASVEGDMVFLPGSNFEVIESCSGLRSIQILLLLAASYAVLFSLPRLHAAILLAAAPLAAFAVNAIRTVALILTPGSEVHEMHALQGALMFFAGSFALGILDLALLRVLHKGALPAPAPRSAPLPGARSWRAAALASLLGLLAAASLWRPPAWRPAPETSAPVLPEELPGWKARPLPLEGNFFGSLLLQRRASVVYEGESGSVQVLVASDDHAIRTQSLLSPKTELPGAGWEIDAEDEVELGPGPVRARALVASGFAQRSLVYLIEGGSGGVLAESLRSALALDRSPFAQREPAWLVRLVTPIAPRPEGQRDAEARLRELFELLGPSLPAKPAPAGARGPAPGRTGASRPQEAGDPPDSSQSPTVDPASPVAPSSSLTMKRGRRRTSIRTRPTYSPRIPSRMNSTPNRKESTTIVWVQPGTFAFSTSLR
jgi:exosortase